MLAIYEKTNDAEAITAMAARIEAQIVKDNEAKKKRMMASSVRKAKSRVVGKRTNSVLKK